MRNGLEILHPLRSGRGGEERLEFLFDRLGPYKRSGENKHTEHNSQAFAHVMVSGSVQCFLKLGLAHPTHPTLVILVARDTLKAHTASGRVTFLT